ncbi:MAG: hypothetical protein AAFW75_18120 [Cyanobacteria bacterium J06636_16]
MNQTVRMQVQYIDGAEQTFEWELPPEADETVNMASHLQKSFREEYILLAMGDRFMILLKQNIKTIEVNTVPAKLPPTAIHGVRLIA